MTETPKAAKRVLLDLARGISGFPDDVLDEFVADAVSELCAADLLRTPGGPSDGPNQNETKSGQEFCFTEAQVEAAARALWELHARGDDPLWAGGELDYGIKQIYRKEARAALTAAATCRYGEER